MTAAAKPSPELAQLWRQLYRKGLSLREIAKQSGVPLGTVRASVLKLDEQGTLDSLGYLRWTPTSCRRCGYEKADCTCSGGFVSPSIDTSVAEKMRRASNAKVAGR